MIWSPLASLPIWIADVSSADRGDRPLGCGQSWGHRFVAGPRWVDCHGFLLLARCWRPSQACAFDQRLAGSKGRVLAHCALVRRLAAPQHSPAGCWFTRQGIRHRSRATSLPSGTVWRSCFSCRRYQPFSTTAAGWETHGRTADHRPGSGAGAQPGWTQFSSVTPIRITTAHSPTCSTDSGLARS